MNLESIFNELLIDHSKYPHHYGNLGDSDISVEGNNVLCGDRIVLNAKISEGKVEEISFTGKACAICTASTSMFCDNAAGQPFEAIDQLRVIFQKYLRGEEISEDEKRFLGDSAALEGVAKLPSRVKCASLVYEAWSLMRKRLVGGESEG